MSDETKDVEIEIEPQEPVKDNKPDKGSKGGPPEGSERWDKIYWEAQEGKRAREERDTLRQQLLSNEQLIKEMSSHNQLLTDAVNKIAGSVDDKAHVSQIDSITSKISALREEKRAAREKADFGSEDRIDDDILDLKLQLKEAKSVKESKKSDPEPNKVVVDTSDDDMSQEEKAIYDNWIEENIWFTSNPKMRKAAIEIEKSVRGNPDFEYATTPEILKAVKTHVEDKFKGIDTGGIDLVSSGSGSSSGIGGVKVKISSAELEIAKGFGVSPQDLAKQKMIITQARQNKTRR